MRATVRAFRGLRFDPARVELGAVVGAPGAAARDPRHVRALLDDAPGPGDGKDAPARRAKLKLAEWRRAGVLIRDDQPALYAVRRRDEDGEEAIGLFCAVGVDAVPPATDAAREARLDTGVAVEPVVASFEEARVRRTVENAIDREADAAWKSGRTHFELWCLDEESTTARVATLLSQAGIDIEENAEALAAQGEWWRRTARVVDDDRPRAGAFALAFLHPVDERWPEIPVGAALAPLRGTLE